MTNKLKQKQERFFEKRYQKVSSQQDFYNGLNVGPEFGPIDGRNFMERYLNIRDCVRSGLGDFDKDWLNRVTTEWGNGPRVVTDLKDGYWKSVVEFHRSAGYQVEATSEFRSIWFAKKLEERAESYKVWLEYIASEDANYIPSFLHAWILEGLAIIGMYKSKTQSVSKRRKNDMYAFIKLYPDCLAKAVTAMQTKIDQPSLDFDDDGLNLIFKNKQNRPGFNTLYSYFYEEKMKLHGDLSEVYAETTGEWRKYTDVSEAGELTRILSAYPQLEWCTKGLSTAQSQLTNGTLDIYFSNVPEACLEQMEEKFATDPSMLEKLQTWREYGYPRLCIRTKNGQIVEARGCDKSQEMDEVISKTSELDERLCVEYGEKGEKFRKINTRLQRFNKLYVKYLSKQDLSIDELIFVQGCSPRFFGYSLDSRVIELKEKVKSKLLIGRDLSGADLSRVNLSGADLSRANLSGADLSGARLTGARLTGANFSGADLTGAYLWGADLFGAKCGATCLNEVIFDDETKWPSISFGVINNIVCGPGVDLRMVNLTGADLRNKNLRGADLRGANLRGADLSGANLNGANLNGANLRECNLSGSDLSNADLSEADLWRADLSRANLSGAVLELVDLSGVIFNDETKWPSTLFCVINNIVFGPGLNFRRADFSGFDFQGADFSGFDFQEANLSGANLSGVNLSGANLRETELLGVDLTGADLRGANLRGANLSGVDLSGSDLREVNLIGADLSNANLRGVDLSGSDLREVNLIGADLSNANFRGADLSGAYLWRASLTGANLSGLDLREANLIDVDLRGLDLTDVKISVEQLESVVTDDTTKFPIWWYDLQNDLISFSLDLGEDMLEEYLYFSDSFVDVFLLSVQELRQNVDKIFRKLFGII